MERPGQPIRAGADAAQLRDLLSWKRRVPAYLGLAMTSIWLLALVAGYGHRQARADMRVTEQTDVVYPPMLPDGDCNAASAVQDLQGKHGVRGKSMSLDYAGTSVYVMHRGLPWSDPAVSGPDGVVHRVFEPWYELLDELPEALECDQLAPLLVFGDGVKKPGDLPDVMMPLNARIQLAAANGTWELVDRDMQTLYRMHVLARDAAAAHPSVYWEGWYTGWPIMAGILVERYSLELPEELLARFDERIRAMTDMPTSVEEMVRLDLDVKLYDRQKRADGITYGDLSVLAPMDVGAMVYPITRRRIREARALYREQLEAFATEPVTSYTTRRKANPYPYVYRSGALDAVPSEIYHYAWSDASSADYRERQRRVELNLRRAMVAAALYRRRHGEFPPDLAALGLTAEQRLDPYSPTGADLQARPGPEGWWRVWSAGSDTVDDGGIFGPVDAPGDNTVRVMDMLVLIRPPGWELPGALRESPDE